MKLETALLIIKETKQGIRLPDWLDGWYIKYSDGEFEDCEGEKFLHINEYVDRKDWEIVN